MKIGYARVSTEEQNESLQIDALKMAGCERIFTDHASGAKTERPELAAALAFARPGDTLVVWKLDRLGRSLQHLIETVTSLKGRDVGLVSLTESLDTSTPGGMLIFHVFGAVAQFERDLIRERTNAGLVSARARGRVGGNRTKMDPDKIRAAQIMHADGMDIAKILATLKISKATLYRYLAEAKAAEKEQSA